jgi:hypothetical protein
MDWLSDGLSSGFEISSPSTYSSPFFLPRRRGKRENEKIEKRGRLGRARLYQHPLGEKKTREEGVVYAV